MHGDGRGGLTAEERELILADHRDAARNRGVLAAAGYVPVFCVIAFCHLTAFGVLLLTARSKRLP